MRQYGLAGSASLHRMGSCFSPKLCDAFHFLVFFPGLRRSCLCFLRELLLVPRLFSRSLIPSTSRLRINYISIEWPLGRGIDIHRPPSAPRPDVYSRAQEPHYTLDYMMYCHRVSGAELISTGLKSKPRLTEHSVSNIYILNANNLQL